MENNELFGGDMLGIDFKNDNDRKAIYYNSQRWPGGVIYYAVDASLSSKLTLIKEAIQHYHENTCIKFKPRTNEADYVVLYSGDGCNSWVGRKGGQQTVSLGSGCDWFRTIVHELMHAVGFYHEQNRPDRDQSIKIHWENVSPAAVPQFRLLEKNETNLLTAFDFDSVMLYGPRTFSNNSGITMESIVPGKTVRDVSPDKGLSANDIYSINKLYECL